MYKSIHFTTKILCGFLLAFGTLVPSKLFSQSTDTTVPCSPANVYEDWKGPTSVDLDDLLTSSDNSLGGIRYRSQGLWWGAQAQEVTFYAVNAAVPFGIVGPADNSSIPVPFPTTPQQPYVNALQECYQIKFNPASNAALGWGTISQTYTGVGITEIRRQDIYVYRSIGGGNMASSSLAGSACPDVYNTALTIVRTNNRNFYEYKVEVLEVNSTNTPVAGGYTWIAGWVADKNRNLLNAITLRNRPQAGDDPAKTLYGVSFAQGKRYAVKLHSRLPNGVVHTATHYVNVNCTPSASASLPNMPTVAGRHQTCTGNDTAPIEVQLAYNTHGLPVTLLEIELLDSDGTCSTSIVVNTPWNPAITPSLRYNLRNYADFRNSLIIPDNIQFKDFKVRVRVQTSVGWSRAGERCFRLLNQSFSEAYFKMTAQAPLSTTGTLEPSTNPSSPATVGNTFTGIDFDQTVTNLSAVERYKVVVQEVTTTGQPIATILNSGELSVATVGIPQSYMFNTYTTPQGYFASLTQSQKQSKRFKVTLTVYGPCGENSQYSYFKIDPNCNYCRPGKSLEVAENHRPLEVQFSPNPVKDALLVRFGEQGLGTTKAQIAIFDLQGKMVLQKQVSDVLQHELDCSQLSDGVYFLRVSTDIEQKTMKFIKL